MIVNKHLTKFEKSFYQYLSEDIPINYEWIEQPLTVDKMNVKPTIN